jgi:hypothetical protein
MQLEVIMNLRRMLVLLSALVLTACAIAPRISNSWRAPEFAGPALKSLLVVGAGPDGASRRSLEDALVQALQSAGVIAVASYSRPLDAEMTQAALARVSREAGADGWIGVRTLKSDDAPVSRGPVFLPGFGFGTGGGFAGASIIFGDSRTQERFATVETSVFSGQSNSMVWSLTTDEYPLSDPGRGNVELAKLLVSELRRAGVI